MTYDFIKETDQIKADQQDFVLSSARWRNFKTSLTLNWQRVKFTKGNKKNIPDQRGIYAFIIECTELGFPPHGYLMYIGMTGQDSDHTLYKRYGDYFGKSELQKRSKLKRMMGKWKSDLHFHFVPIPDKRYSLTKLETALCDAIIPPCNVQDFSAEIRREVKAL